MNMALCDKGPSKSLLLCIYIHWTFPSVKMFQLFFYPSIVLLYIISSFLADLISTLVFVESRKKNKKHLFKYSEKF